MKRPALLVLAFLAACGTTPAPFKGEGYSISMPQGWSYDDSRRGYTATTIGAFLRNDARGGKYVLTIQKHKLPTASTTTAQFNRLVIDNSERTAGFQEKSREDVTIDGEETTLLTFRLGDKPEHPTYLETSIVKGGGAYVLVATMPAAPDDAIAKQVREAILSFTPAESAAPLSTIPTPPPS